MEKVMLAIGKFKEGEGHFEKFMGFMQNLKSTRKLSQKANLKLKIFLIKQEIRL